MINKGACLSLLCVCIFFFFFFWLRFCFFVCLLLLWGDCLLKLLFLSILYACVDREGQLELHGGPARDLFQTVST